MISKVDCQYESVSDEVILDDDYDSKIENSLGDEVTDTVNGLQDLDVVSYHNCCKAFSDDSGFNSDNESRDSVDEGVLGPNCECSDPLCDCLENSSLDSSLQRNINLAMKLKLVVQPHEKADIILLNSSLIEVDSGEISNKSNISTKNKTASTRRRPTSAISPVDLDAPANLRTTRRTRRAEKDLNNNESGSRNLNSFFKKAPFKIQDCFQNRGFLSLVACIIYTLVLMVVIGILSMVLSSLKSYIGTRNLKTMRKNIVHHRRTREHMAAG